jgi:hypothetical protein
MEIVVDSYGWVGLGVGLDVGGDGGGFRGLGWGAVGFWPGVGVPAGVPIGACGPPPRPKSLEGSQINSKRR